MNHLNETQKLVLHDFGSTMVQERYIKNVENGLRDSEKKIIGQYMDLGSRILDIGCGTGRTTIALQRLGYQMTGLDITPEMIANAKMIAKEKKLSIVYEVGDATQLGYEDNTVDNILFLTNGRTQIPGEINRIKALQEIYRVLKPGAIFILIFHARHENDRSLFRLSQRFKHIILKNLGFTIKEIDYGDLFFWREINNKRINQKQFMHIADPEKVRNDLLSIGFELLFYGRENAIVEKNLNDKDNVYNYPPMFAVCRK